MNVGAAFKADAQASILMQPGQGAFDDPSIDAQAAAVGFAALGQSRANPPLFECRAMAPRIISPVGEDDARFLFGPSASPLESERCHQPRGAVASHRARWRPSIERSAARLSRR